MPVSVSVYTGHTLQCTLCIHCSGAKVAPVYPDQIPVYLVYTVCTLGAQCTVLVYAQCAISVPSVHCQCTSSVH